MIHPAVPIVFILAVFAVFLATVWEESQRARRRDYRKHESRHRSKKVD